MRIYLIAIFILISQTVSAHSGSAWPVGETFKSDTINIKHYEVFLDWTGVELKGSCLIQFKAILDSVEVINFDLIRLKVDSVKDANGTIIPFSHNDSILSIPITRLRKDDSTEIKVYYHGTPFHENWGGWHKNSSYSFNLGVGFQSIPHNLGKAWHPCFDNFIERATYRVSIKTAANLVATGGGVLESEVVNGATKTTTWNLKQEIPTYLYGIAISDYVVTRDTIDGVYGKMPVELYSKSKDVNRLKAGFKNLDSAYKTFERRFGPYHWDKVGYSITNIGAMEHATNIAFPENSITNENIMAHELAHHWWGNLVTCEADRDMWINEGMSVFSEYLFLEDLYGMHQMNMEKESNLYQVVRNAHLNEGGYQPLSGIPREYAYGIHTYRKGSIAAHNLRRYMGDSLFFAGMKSILEGFKFNFIDANEFRNKLKFESGVDLNNFFDQWIIGVGMPDYQLHRWSSKATPGLYDVEVSILQQMAGSQVLFTNMPITIRFWDANENHWEREIRFNGQLEKYKFQFPVNVVHVELNPSYEISYAMTSSRDTLFAKGAMNTANTDFNITVESITDTSRLRLETHWTGPSISVENMVRLGARVSNSRYWYLHGFNGGAVALSGTTFYDGGSNKIDSGLIKYDEDSLILLYRDKIGGEWVIHNDYNIVVGSPSDKRGVVQIKNMKLGEYVLAERDTNINESLLSIPGPSSGLTQVTLYPNPTGGIVSIETSEELTHVSIQIIDLWGREVIQIQKEQIDRTVELDLQNSPDGIYFYVMQSDQGEFSGRFVKHRQD